MARGHCHTRHPATVCKAVADARTLSVTALLTYPGADLAGDVVVPGGLDFGRHEADPWCDLEHSRTADVGSYPVAWARQSLKKAGSPYSVRWGDFAVDGVTHRLPVGTSYFDASDRISSQVFALCERDALPGVSLEFVPDWRVAKSLGPSPMPLGRDAMEFPAARVVRWTHCARPVNAGALTVTKALAPPDALLRVLRDGKVGGEPLDARIYKSLAHHLPSRVTVPVEKAMDTPDTPYDAAADDAGMGDGADQPPAQGGIAALYAKAQALLDACEQNETDMETSDSPELRAFAAKMCDKCRAIAEEIKGKADAHDAKLNGQPPPDDGDGDEEGDEGTDTEAGPPDMSTDDEDGTLKAVRPVYRTILKARRPPRYTAGQVEKAVATAQRADAERKRTKRLLRAVEENSAVMAEVKKLLPRR